jgi:hypothetical protein
MEKHYDSAAHELPDYSNPPIEAAENTRDCMLDKIT